MTEFQTGGIFRASGLPYVTFWRRLVRLDREGVIRRKVVKVGGWGGSTSSVEFDGTSEALVKLISDPVAWRERQKLVRQSAIACQACGRGIPKAFRWPRWLV